MDKPATSSGVATAPTVEPSVNSPLPWRVVQECSVSLTMTDIEAADGSLVCEFCTDEITDAMNAEFIVRVCNSYDLMLAELERIAAVLPLYLWNDRGVLVWSMLDVERVNAVIAKAEGR